MKPKIGTGFCDRLAVAFSCEAGVTQVRRIKLPGWSADLRCQGKAILAAGAAGMNNQRRYQVQEKLDRQAQEKAFDKLHDDRVPSPADKFCRFYCSYLRWPVSSQSSLQACPPQILGLRQCLLRKSEQFAKITRCRSSSTICTIAEPCTFDCRSNGTPNAKKPLSALSK